MTPAAAAEPSASVRYQADQKTPTLRAAMMGLHAQLVIVSSLFQFLLSARLLLLRRLFTTTVTGTVIMLISVTVMPIVFDQLTLAPENAAPAAGPISFAAAIVVVAAPGGRNIEIRRAGIGASIGAL